MEFDSDVDTGIRRAQTAMKDALARCADSFDHSDIDRMFIGYVETVAWACALDELLDSDAEYVRRRNQDEGGKILLGLRWTRNKGLHELVSMHGIARLSSTGVPSPVFRGSPGLTASWLPRSDVVLRSQTGRGAKSGSDYDNYVAGREIWPTLREARNFLWLRARPVGFQEVMPWNQADRF